MQYARISLIVAVTEAGDSPIAEVLTGVGSREFVNIIDINDDALFLLTEADVAEYAKTSSIPPFPKDDYRI